MNDKPEDFDEDAFVRGVRRDSHIDFTYPDAADEKRTVYDVLALICLVVAVVGGGAFIWIAW